MSTWQAGENYLTVAFDPNTATLLVDMDLDGGAVELSYTKLRELGEAVEQALKVFHDRT